MEEGTPYLRLKILEEHYQNLEFQMTLMYLYMTIIIALMQQDFGGC